MVDVDPRLREWIKFLEPTRWATGVLDADFKVVWISDELKGFAGTRDEDEIGYGKHILEAFLLPAFSSKMTSESIQRMFVDGVPFILETDRGGKVPYENVPEPWRSLIDELEPAPMPFLWSSWFEWQQDNDPRPYRVDIVGVRINDENGKLIGCWFVTFMGVRPNLLVLLAQGDEQMYERMGRLVEPARRQAAVLSCEVDDPGSLARQLSTSAYFKTMRNLMTEIDDRVARNTGIVGQHSNEGAIALFLVEDLGSSSAAVAAALRTARGLQEVAAGIKVSDGDGTHGLTLNVGVHWGGNLYVGQLVPGGRLDVSALGDEMNESHRMQQCATGGLLLASKTLLEHLDPDDAESLGLDLDKVSYVPLAELPSADERAVRDAGNLPVAELELSAQ